MEPGHSRLGLDMAGSRRIRGVGYRITTVHGFSCPDTVGLGSPAARGCRTIRNQFY